MGNVIELAASKRDPFRFPITFTVSPTAQIVLYYYLSRYQSLLLQHITPITMRKEANRD